MLMPLVAVGTSRTPALCTITFSFVSRGSWVPASRLTARDRYRVDSEVSASGAGTCAPRSHGLDPAASERAVLSASYSLQGPELKKKKKEVFKIKLTVPTLYPPGSQVLI